MQSMDPFTLALRGWTRVFMRRSMRNIMLFTKKAGISMPQLGLLINISRGASSVTELAEKLGVTSAAVSQMLERLVQQGMILRTEDPHDRRARQMTLTDKSRQLVLESLNARQGWLDEVSQALSEDEKIRVTEGLNILINKSNDLDSNPGCEDLLSDF